MLKINGLHGGYGEALVLCDITLDVARGEIVSVLGHNGAGKTTLLKTIMGMIKAKDGRITCKDMDIGGIPPYEIARLGVGYIPQGRKLFSPLTVAENLEIGLMARQKSKKTLEKILAMFPVLGERLSQPSGTLSGGEQQMLAIARALCLEPELLLIDEPTEGLQPSMTRFVGDMMHTLKQQGVAILLAEQRVQMALDVADRIMLLENGRGSGLMTGAEARNTLKSRASI